MAAIHDRLQALGLGLDGLCCRFGVCLERWFAELLDVAWPTNLDSTHEHVHSINISANH
jgi:hypothetical protein